MAISSGIIEAGADAVGDMPSTIIVSSLSIICMILTVLTWGWIMMAFLSTTIVGRSGSTFMWDADVEYNWKLYFIAFNAV